MILKYKKDYPGSTENPEHCWTINFTNGRKHTLSSALVSKRKGETSKQTSREANKKLNASATQRRSHLNPVERKNVNIPK